MLFPDEKIPAGILPAGIACRGELFADDDSLRLRLQAKLRRLEGVRLCHGVFRAVDAVEDQLAKERVTDLAAQR